MKKKTTIKDINKRIDLLRDKYIYLEGKVEKLGVLCDEHFNHKEPKVLGQELFEEGEWISQPQYKVGDYVECNVRNTGNNYNEKIYFEKFKGKITEVLPDGRYKVWHYHILPNDIIGYANYDLLTPEEKEYLSCVIKPYKNLSIFIYKNSSDYLIIEVPCFAYIQLQPYDDKCEFRGLEHDKQYTLEELGL